jgi:hypothetical protein
MCIVSVHGLETDSCATSGINAEVGDRVYWTNVLIDPKVWADVLFAGCSSMCLRNA